MTEEQLNRLNVAKDTRKYGHLQTWEELFYFQKMFVSSSQVQEIAACAHLYNQHHPITLPLAECPLAVETIKQTTAS